MISQKFSSLLCLRKLIACKYIHLSCCHPCDNHWVSEEGLPCHKSERRSNQHGQHYKQKLSGSHRLETLNKNEHNVKILFSNACVPTEPCSKCVEGVYHSRYGCADSLGCACSAEHNSFSCNAGCSNSISCACCDDCVDDYQSCGTESTTQKSNIWRSGTPTSRNRFPVQIPHTKSPFSNCSHPDPQSIPREDVSEETYQMYTHSAFPHPRSTRLKHSLPVSNLPGFVKSAIPTTSKHFNSLSPVSMAALTRPGRVSHLGQRRHFTRTVDIKEEDVVTSTDIQKFLADAGVKFEQGYTCFVSACPRIARKRGTSVVKDKLYINMTTGHFLCIGCGKLGGWHELKDNIALLTTVKKIKKGYECFTDVESIERLDRDAPRVAEILTDSVSVKDLDDEHLQTLRQDLDCPKLTRPTLEKFNVKYSPIGRTVLFPYHNLDGETVGIKRISCKVGDDGITKTLRDTQLPRSGVLGLFGWSTVTSDTTEIVLTTSELNAMTVYQETRIPALSLPRGCLVLAQEVLPCLERFTKILLWFGDDIRAWGAAKQFAKKLNTKRCYVIRPTAEDPSPITALKQGLRLKNILSRAKPISHKSIVSFSQLRQEIFSELAHVEQVAGVKWRRYPALNRLLKGHRRGELTVFTGPTGSGKTTFMSDYSLDLCIQGVNTMWGSFEINNVRLGKMMLTQFAMKNMSKNLAEFDIWANQFEELPMYFMTFHGEESIKKVIETMSHAVYVHDIAHVIVDNLQFMMGVNGDISDRFTRQDMIISAFRRFATRMNCHVSLVIHPRKEKDTEDLTTASIFGSAKASQEADNVLILQDKRLSSLRGRKYIQVTKNRFDGELGIVLLKFDKESLSFTIKDKPKKVDGKKEKHSADETPVEDDLPYTFHED